MYKTTNDIITSVTGHVELCKILQHKCYDHVPSHTLEIWRYTCSFIILVGVHDQPGPTEDTNHCSRKWEGIVKDSGGSKAWTYQKTTDTSVNTPL